MEVEGPQLVRHVEVSRLLGQSAHITSGRWTSRATVVISVGRNVTRDLFLGKLDDVQARNPEPLSEEEAAEVVYRP